MINLSEVTDEFDDFYIRELIRSLQEEKILRASGVSQSRNKYARCSFL